MNTVARWNDGRYIKLGRSDEAFLTELIRSPSMHNLHHSPARGRSSRRFTTCRFASCYPRRIRRSGISPKRTWAPAESSVHVIEISERATHAFCGHSHFPAEADDPGISKPSTSASLPGEDVQDPRHLARRLRRETAMHRAFPLLPKNANLHDQPASRRLNERRVHAGNSFHLDDVSHLAALATTVVIGRRYSTSTATSLLAGHKLNLPNATTYKRSLAIAKEPPILLTESEMRTVANIIGELVAT